MHSIKKLSEMYGGATPSKALTVRAIRTLLPGSFWKIHREAFS
jgi:hypothetical protein